MAFNFSTDFDGSITESAIMFSNDSPSAIDVVVVEVIFAKSVDALVDRFAVADKLFCTS